MPFGYSSFPVIRTAVTYSYLGATIGSTLIARRAGAQFGTLAVAPEREVDAWPGPRELGRQMRCEGYLSALFKRWMEEGMAP